MFIMLQTINVMGVVTIYTVYNNYALSLSGQITTNYTSGAMLKSELSI